MCPSISCPVDLASWIKKENSSQQTHPHPNSNHHTNKPTNTQHKDGTAMIWLALPAVALAGVAILVSTSWPGATNGGPTTVDEYLTSASFKTPSGGDNMNGDYVRARFTPPFPPLTCEDPGELAFICLVHRKAFESTGSDTSIKIKTFYEELSIPTPHPTQDKDIARLTGTWAIKALQARIQELQDWGMDEEEYPKDERLLLLRLMYSVLASDASRRVYNAVFVPGLTGSWSATGPYKFLRKRCVWEDDDKKGW
ncbi:hypothetical protein QBC39DRAFT_364481 [Podospora conica]|nr:hypothetical protein QBC39DRAFT_364481 [Schizothecium conicum]